jgi:hypothetical protein
LPINITLKNRIEIKKKKHKLEKKKHYCNKLSDVRRDKVKPPPFLFFVNNVSKLIGHGNKYRTSLEA